MKTLSLFVLSIFLSISAGAAERLRVSPDGRFLQYADGRPFFYLGDTAWQLFHRLTREEADLYLKDRSEKGFTVIQAVVIAELDGLNTHNAYGELPLHDRDPLRPNEAYFSFVDYVVDRAEQLGLYIGMLPSWGSYWSENRPDLRILNEQNARAYGRFLGRRYADKPIIWILGGDHNIHTESERRTVEELAKGLREGDGGAHLITFHPRGPGFSSDYLHQAPWLDFNMIQSSHAAHDHDNGLFVEHDYRLTPPKPTLDGEPRYEALNVGFYFDGVSRLDRFDDYDCRQAAYWAMLAGACGHTYGHSSIWQMWKPNRSPVLGANIPWQEALNDPGSRQMGYLRRLFESRPWQKLRPAQDMILSGPDFGGAKIRAALAEDRSFAFIYSPRGEAFTIDRSRVSGQSRREIWFDPRYGIAYAVHTGDTAGIQTYTPPTAGRGQDWLLILEDASKNYPLPQVRR
ncbi:MAG: glycoside hydrolase family 140 protein [candidate division KSB1 bacterium]|nr:glycoside hydrolase family 140 protein [candidate division KSB1 bacterium]MDZ7345681.1 glycoside hydrolase family 140 protein [candidate division KSB1 bacterium]